MGKSARSKIIRYTTSSIQNWCDDSQLRSNVKSLWHESIRLLVLHKSRTNWEIYNSPCLESNGDYLFLGKLWIFSSPGKRQFLNAVHYNTQLFIHTATIWAALILDLRDAKVNMINMFFFCLFSWGLHSREDYRKQRNKKPGKWDNIQYWKVSWKKVILVNGIQRAGR